MNLSAHQSHSMPAFRSYHKTHNSKPFVNFVGGRAVRLSLQARNGEADRTPEDILSMVKAQAQPAHRLVEGCGHVAGGNTAVKVDGGMEGVAVCGTLEGGAVCCTGQRWVHARVWQTVNLGSNPGEHNQGTA